MSIRQYINNYVQNRRAGLRPASPVGVGLDTCAGGRRCRQ